MKKHNKSWVYTIVWLMLVTLCMLVTVITISYMVAFSKNTKWIENSLNSYYQSYKWVEESLFSLIKHNWSDWNSWSVNNTLTWYSYIYKWSWSTIEWKITYSNPINLNIWGQWSSYLDDFELTLSWLNTSRTWKLKDINEKFIMISITSDLNKINLEWWTYIWDSINNTLPLAIATITWMTVEGSWQTLKTFYYDECREIGSGCKINISIIRTLKTLNNWELPYLNYKIINPGKTIPLQNIEVQTVWKSYWFQKIINFVKQNETANAVFDFTVFN